MLWRLFHPDFPSQAHAYRRVHERWLTRALGSGKNLPRIPLRRVDQGGFAPMLTRPSGRVWSERWWSCAFSRLDD